MEIFEIRGNRYSAKFAPRVITRVDSVITDDDENLHNSDDCEWQGKVRNYYRWEAEAMIRYTEDIQTKCFIMTPFVVAHEWRGDFWTDLLRPLDPKSTAIVDQEKFIDFILISIFGRVSSKPTFPTPRLDLEISREPSTDYRGDHLTLDFMTLIAHGILLTDEGQRSLPLVP